MVMVAWIGIIGEIKQTELFVMRVVRYSCLIISIVCFVLYVVYDVKVLLALAFISAILSTVIYKKMRKDKTQS